MSEPVQERKKPGPKPKLPKVSILDRRLANPFGNTSVPITLRTPGEWEIRWVYSKLRPGRLYDMTHNKGWVFVQAEELHGAPDEYGLTVKDQRLVRGDHGEEVLMKMPAADFRKIQQAKAQYNERQLGKKAMQHSVAQATAQQHGSEAGDAVFDAFKHGDITDKRGPDPTIATEEWHEEA